ncbi:MAG: DEAD/DEAH box helicase [Planctomycetes bacterium]|nr:DEAD/DEAH box helicase [Planctomycetota bacterium]
MEPKDEFEIDWPETPPPEPPTEEAAREETEAAEKLDDDFPATTLEDLPEALREAVARAGWDRLLPVQARAIPPMLAGRHLMIQSRTGTGKTAGFLLPILHRLDPSRAVCQALVMVPTRELARQVTAEAEILFGGHLRTVPVYGGVAYGPQIDGFRKGAHVVVGTPGRVLDHLIKGSLTLEHLSMLVIDEADRMLSMGFYPDMKKIQRYLPERGLTSSMFSATFPPFVLHLAEEFLRAPEILSLSRDHVHVTQTEHVFHIVEPMEKDRTLVRIIEIENPISAFIFCNRKSQVHYVTVVLQRFGYDADELSSDLTQKARDAVMARVRDGSLRFLVTTDVAARGIDIPALSHVIQYDPPEDHEAYIHRTGRTGRVDASGKAITLVTTVERYDLQRIGERYGIEFQERPLPTDADVQAIVEERVTALLEARVRARDSLERERMQRFIPLAGALAESEDESAIIAMLLDDYYQQTLHAPPPRPSLAAEASDGRARTGEGGGERTERRGRKSRRGGRRGGSGGGGESREEGRSSRRGGKRRRR